jgi:hypothetical protein
MVQMIQRRGGPRLTHEALHRRFVPLEGRAEELECDLPRQQLVLGRVDDSHSTLAKLRVDTVVGDRLANHVRELRGRRLDPRIAPHTESIEP